MLVAFSGLPGTGKTTLAMALAARRSAAYVRVDEIEHALKGVPGLEIGPAGYLVAFAVAASNLRLGNLVIADCVNPVPESRQGWRDAARQASVRLVEVEVVCSDERDHRHRVETRAADIAGFALPTWSLVKAHRYVPWTSPRLVLDTSLLSPDEGVRMIEARMDSAPERAAL